MNPIQIDAVGLVTGLPGTGSDPPPSPQRSALIAEMQTRGVNNPKQTAGVEHGRTGAGARRACGLAFKRETTSTSRSAPLAQRRQQSPRRLADGSPAAGDGRARQPGSRRHTVLGLAQGAVLVDPSGKEKVQRESRSLMLGGGVA